ncbi:hypothetical protein GF380_03765 [Candidatus Uhrbacteria bacterium]|nr:hypothetical protein [Candidatus Uhrbacteria bacterium]
MPFHVPNHPLFRALRDLHLPAKDYVVFGSGPLWIRGIRPSGDLDLLARGAAWDRLLEIGQVEDGDGCSKCIRLANGKIEVYNQWCTASCNVDDVIRHADVIEGIPFAKLQDVLCWKSEMKRDKDVEDIAMIEEYLKKHPEETIAHGI